MSSDGADKQVAKWDPGFTRQIANVVGPAIKRYFRAEVRDLESIPAAGGALVVSNHSGGMFTPDVLVFAPAFYEQFGFDRPVYTLGHDMIFVGPIGTWLRRLGVIEANRANAAQALRDGAVVLVFPGGDYDSYRPTFTENVIDFNGRTGYIRTAVETGVPIVPMVSIGAQETQLFLARGDSIARTSRTQAAAGRDPADQRRLPLRRLGVLPTEPAVAVQDRHPNARSDRRRRGVRRGPRHRRGRPACARGDAEGP